MRKGCAPGPGLQTSRVLPGSGGSCGPVGATAGGMRTPVPRPSSEFGSVPLLRRSAWASAPRFVSREGRGRGYGVQRCFRTPDPPGDQGRGMEFSVHSTRGSVTSKGPPRAPIAQHTRLQTNRLPTRLRPSRPARITRLSRRSRAHSHAHARSRTRSCPRPQSTPQLPTPAVNPAPAVSTPAVAPARSQRSPDGRAGSLASARVLLFVRRGDGGGHRRQTKRGG
jgi:hypothetical protein